MKKLIAICLSGVLIMSMPSAFAEVNNKYSLFELEKLLLENNISYLTDHDTFLKEERDFKDAKTQSDGVQEYNYKKEPYDNYEVEIKKNLNPVKAEKELLTAKFKDIDTTNKLKLELQVMYQTYLYDKELLKNITDQFNLMKKNLEIKEKEKELGTISEIQFIEFTKDYTDMYKTLLSQSNKVAKESRDLAIFTGIEMVDDLELERVGLKPYEVKSENIEGLKETMQNSSYRVQGLELDKVIAETELLYKHRFAGFTDAKKEIEDLKDKIEDLPRQINNEKKTVILDLTTHYNDYLIEEQNLMIAKIKMDQAVRTSKADKVKFDQGMISEITYIKSNYDLITAQYNYSLSQLNFYNKSQVLKNFIDVNTMTYRILENPKQ